MSPMRSPGYWVRPATSSRRSTAICPPSVALSRTRWIPTRWGRPRSLYIPVPQSITPPCPHREQAAPTPHYAKGGMMGTVYEDVMVMGSDEPLRTLERDEHLLLAPPHPSPVPVKLWRDHPLLPIVHFSQRYEAQPFAPPRDVYENAQFHIEWQ